MKDSKRFFKRLSVIFDVLENIKSNERIHTVVLHRKRGAVRLNEPCQSAFATKAKCEGAHVEAHHLRPFSHFLRNHSCPAT